MYGVLLFLVRDCPTVANAEALDEVFSASAVYSKVEVSRVFITLFKIYGSRTLSLTHSFNYCPAQNPFFEFCSDSQFSFS